MTAPDSVGRVVVRDGIALAVRELGVEDGPAVLALHGFPETGATWGPLAERLAAAGRRVVAPDMRGHGLSDAPRPVCAYRLDELVADVVALIDHIGAPVDLVGHDWGGAVGWVLAERHPDLVRTANLLATAHPIELRSALRRDAGQRRRSRYILLAQIPGLPERYLARDDHEYLARFFGATHSADEIAAYRACWSRPDVVRGMLNYYRAVVRSPGPDPSVRGSGRPIHLISGSDDPLFGRRLIDAGLARDPRSEHTVLDGVGHSPHRQATDRVAELLLGRWADSG